ncbi:MAG: AAA family ATPase, partial [Cyanobacteria bacterium REEB65]|nr:AAA family ATPase [Cyanobacteria bacterium REEB65]
MSLYQKYRPETFDQVVGNEKLIEQLGALLVGEDPPHAYLLHGPSGCGKTTIGRIAARCLGVADDDFVEVDSADFRGIDTIRDMRRNAMFRALRGERRMWLLDECHKLSNDAMNALLKGLEDPPPHVYYVLCTTDPDKLLPTIRGRCVSFQVSRLDQREMVRLLNRVATAEGVRLDRTVLQVLAERADGHSRDALQALEKVLVTDEADRMAVVEGMESLKSTSVKLVQAML